jgi:hypothetical protein
MIQTILQSDPTAAEQVIQNFVSLGTYVVVVGIILAGLVLLVRCL